MTEKIKCWLCDGTRTRKEGTDMIYCKDCNAFVGIKAGGDSPIQSVIEKCHDKSPNKFPTLCALPKGHTGNHKDGEYEWWSIEVSK